ncbi:ECF subfamily RNA polymerase sigma-70 factor [Actinoplanes sp. SE50]|uniref:sigma factor-like helix-turn-helix DNA-binding protein n=1 Tax=unclassified Actinoplanes TaxID=2626549 RepID=UPI00023ECF62|nr:MULTISPECIES: sigma factor-like helix-turn-helix DNA-binding protein [unclassified Actinoplanes]AEV87778.1 RNA polymerase sigma-70 factor, ECF subfamily [Actinoplanes sp. SE50/110]ATO86180.1 ECF subfamily RNA polymerase sigma-70 factor [Actinoplanes sp. SE50]SLM03594.1 ECF subfamily RNA polymerase sigma-70 factor [Actinoplanes sp. SE50/110]
MPAWLTTVTGRVCLDMLRARGSRREEPPVAESPGAEDPERDAVLADSVGAALHVVLEMLTPAERLAFVLHDLFAVSFDEIAVVVGRSPAAARQLASRARRRVHGGSPAGMADFARQRRIVDAFLAAARGGDFAGLLSLLDPDVMLRMDDSGARLGEGTTAEQAARFFCGRAHGAIPATIDGAAGAFVRTPFGARIALSFTVAGDRIIAIDAIMDPDDAITIELLT